MLFRGGLWQYGDQAVLQSCVGSFLFLPRLSPQDSEPCSVQGSSGPVPSSH